MDYEHYHTDEYDITTAALEDVDTHREILALFSPAYQKAGATLARLFRPVATVQHARCMFPLEAAAIDGIPLLHCKTVADLEGTLLR